MRIVVFSDSHNNYFVLKDIVTKEQSADWFIHLGDGEREFDTLATNYPFRPMRNVSGNCDWGSMTKTQDLMTLEGKRMFFTHGHMLGIKSGLDGLRKRAAEVGADIALFGHTHEAMTAYEDGIYYMNPGSVSQPRGSGGRSYGVVEITNAGIVTFIVEF